MQNFSSRLKNKLHVLYKHRSVDIVWEVLAVLCELYKALSTLGKV